MHGLVFAYGVTVLCWGAVAYKLPAFRRRPHDAGVRAYWLTLLLIALGLTVLQWPAYPALDAAAHHPNLARLLGDGLALGASWTVQAFLFHLNYPDQQAKRPIRACAWALLIALVLMALFFLLIPSQPEDADLLNHAAGAPFVLEYRLAFLAYLGLALVNVVRLSWRYAAHATRPSMRLGLRLVATGGVLGLAYVAHEAAWVLAPRLGAPHLLSPSQTLPRLVMAGGIGLMVAGSTMPSWGPLLGVDALYRAAAYYRSLQRLYPLWRVLYEAMPTIALLPPVTRLAEWLDVRDLRLRLYRRVVEIRDGMVALRPYVDARTPTYARQYCEDAKLPAAEARVVVEAATLASALRGFARGRPAMAGSGEKQPSGGLDLASEVQALEQFARCYRRSPHVRAVRAHLERGEAAEARPEPDILLR